MFGKPENFGAPPKFTAKNTKKLPINSFSLDENDPVRIGSPNITMEPELNCKRWVEIVAQQTQTSQRKKLLRQSASHWRSLMHVQPKSFDGLLIAPGDLWVFTEKDWLGKLQPGQWGSRSSIHRCLKQLWWPLMPSWTDYLPILFEKFAQKFGAPPKAVGKSRRVLF